MNTQNRKLQTTGLDVKSEAFVTAPQTTDQRETCSRTAASKNTSGASNSQDLELRSIRCFARGWAAMCFSSIVFSSNTFEHLATRSKTTKMWKPRECQCQCECQLQLQMSDVHFKCKCQIVWQKTTPIPIRVAHYKSNGADAVARASTHVPTTTNVMTNDNDHSSAQPSVLKALTCPESQGACALAHSLLGEFSRIMLEMFSECSLCKHRAASNEFGMFLLWKMVTRFTHEFRLGEKMSCLSSAPKAWVFSLWTSIGYR